MATQCPKCGFEQPGGDECHRCGIIFERFSRAQEPPPPPLEPVEAPVPEKAAPSSSLGAIYRRARWVVLAGCVLVLALILRQDTPPAVQEDPRAEESLQLKLRNIQPASSYGQPQTLRLNEAEINTWVSSNLALNPEIPETPSDEVPTVEEVQSNVKDLKILLMGDSLLAYVVFNLYGKDLSLTLEGRLRVEDGFIRLSPTAAKLGSLPLPRATIDRAVKRLFESPENREQFRLPPDITDLRVENGELVFEYR
jgi:hypothetical protein